MPVPKSGNVGWLYNRLQRNYDRETGAVTREADLYRAALEKATYGDAAGQYGQGLDQITSYLAGAGPQAYGGAGTALRKKLYSQIYGQARNRVGQGYADYLAQALAARRNFMYQKELAKLQNKGTGIGGVVGGLAGAVGGPFLGAVGAGLGARLIK